MEFEQSNWTQWGSKREKQLNHNEFEINPCKTKQYILVCVIHTHLAQEPKEKPLFNYSLQGQQSQSIPFI